jgi:multiple sugar transport system permease protein
MAAVTKRKTMTAQRRWEALTGFLFLSPTLANFLAFTLGALLIGLGLSLTDFGFFSAPNFVGLGNFQQLAADSRVGPIFGNTVQYVAGMVALDLVWSLSLALALNSFMPNILKIAFRTVFFFPVLTSGAVIAVVWRYLFNTDMGIVNWFLGQFGLQPVPWLVSSQFAIPAVILSTVWNGVGFNMILFIAALQSVPRELYEAAEIDGAGRLDSFRRITLPLITPTIFFVLVKGLIGVFQLFDTPYMLTSGGPGDASRSIVMYIYELGFKTMRLGYASTIALTLFVIIMAITAAQFAIQRRWVFYR